MVSTAISSTTITTANITSSFLNVLTSGTIPYLNNTQISTSQINSTNITSNYLNVSTNVSIGALNITPGYRGTTSTLNYITYDLPSVGTHYFLDNVEVENNITCNGNLTLQGSGTATFPNTITLNKATAGAQTISCSAPDGLTIRTTTNSAAINFGAQSTSGVYTNILRVSANTNPRVIMNIFEVQINDKTNSSQSATLNVDSSGFRMSSTASSGAGGVLLDASQSTSGAGAITLITKNGTPSNTTGLILSGTALTTGTTAIPSDPRYMCVTINGTLYKLVLFNPSIITDPIDISSSGVSIKGNVYSTGISTTNITSSYLNVLTSATINSLNLTGGLNLPYFNAIGITSGTINSTNITSSYLNVSNIGTISYLNSIGITTSILNIPSNSGGITIDTNGINSSDPFTIGSYGSFAIALTDLGNTTTIPFVIDGNGLYTDTITLNSDKNINQSGTGVINQTGTNINNLKSTNIIGNTTITYLNSIGITATTINASNITSSYLNVLTSSTINNLITTNISSTYLNITDSATIQNLVVYNFITQF